MSHHHGPHNELPRTAVLPAAAGRLDNDDTVMIARQPIFDPKSSLYGYELLFRSSRENRYAFTDPRLASAHTMNRALSVFGLPSVVGPKKAFFNFTYELIAEEMYAALPKDRCVIEVLETTLANEEAVNACRKLRAAGYELALDDVVEPSNEGGLLEIADYIKLDLRNIPTDRRRAVIEKLRPLGSKIIAEKVETKEEFVQAMEAGCALAQGYFFCKPELISGKPVMGLECTQMDLLRELNRPELSFERLEQVIKRDAAICLRLLQYLDSAGLGLQHKITSVRHALVLLGEKAVRKWGTLVGLTNIGRRQPSEVLTASLVRAHFCERLAAAEAWVDRQYEMFLVGLLSMIDAVMGLPTEVAIQQLNPPDRVKAVLLADAAAPREMLQVHALAQACERGAWGAVIKNSAGLRTTQPEMAVMYFDALCWADQTSSAVAA
jgi:EAL and modified HD-GYP domain-containing signal transduction protein